MIINYTYLLFVFVVVLYPKSILECQSYNEESLPYIHILKRYLQPSEIFIPTEINKNPGHLTKNGWAELIDNTWGSGLPTNAKLEIFDAVCDSIDRGYGAFVNYDVNIDSLRSLYRPEIETGVSRGRFAAIMNYLSLALKDLHTFVMDIPVNYGTYPSPGIPLFVVGTATEITRFGAGLTPLPDGSLLVYKVANFHTLGLEPGDIVLGYDGVPWKTLYKQLIEYELPISHHWWGSSDDAMEHIMLQSAGLNWHLFDMIDIVKYSTGDSLHLSTQPLIQQTQYGRLWGNEQLNIPGVPMPDFLSGNLKNYISYGVVQGTDVGYIYVGSWHWDPQYQISEQWYEAVYDLMFNHQTSGLIVDFRLNYGGYMLEAHEGYSLLFNTEVSEVAFDIRGDPNDHLDMVPHPYFTASFFTIPGDPATFYDKPIAVLTGPNAVSNGDWESLRLGFHPMARVFGKGSNGAYTSSDFLSLGYSNWTFQRATGSGYLVNGHTYLAHLGAPIDEDVWLTQDDVANSDDSVVKAALEWINGTTDTRNKPEEIPYTFRLEQNYPNPFNSTTRIQYSISKEERVILRVYNIMGEEVAELVNQIKSPGIYEIEYSSDMLSSGIYIYYIKTGSYSEARRMVQIK